MAAAWAVWDKRGRSGTTVSLLEDSDGEGTPLDLQPFLFALSLYGIPEVSKQLDSRIEPIFIALALGFIWREEIGKPLADVSNIDQLCLGIEHISDISPVLRPVENNFVDNKSSSERMGICTSA